MMFFLLPSYVPDLIRIYSLTLPSITLSVKPSQPIGEQSISKAIVPLWNFINLW